MTNANQSTFVVVFNSFGCGYINAPSLQTAIEAGNAQKKTFGEFSVQTSNGRVWFDSRNGLYY